MLFATIDILFIKLASASWKTWPIKPINNEKNHTRLIVMMLGNDLETP